MKYKRIFGIAFGLAMIGFGIFAPYFTGRDKIAVMAIMGVCGMATAILSAFGLMFCNKTSFCAAAMAMFGAMSVVFAIGVLACSLGGMSMYPVRLPAYEFGAIFGFAGFVAMTFLYSVYRAKRPGFLKVLGDAAAALMLVPAFTIIGLVAFIFLDRTF